MDRLRDLRPILLVLAAAAFASSSCEERAGKTPAAPRRFDAVKSGEKAAAASRVFCEKSYPASGAGARRWVRPPSRAIPSVKAGKPSRPGGDLPAGEKQGASWIWVNFWASWCGPCLKEMPLLDRWKSSLEKEGLSVRFELWSVDTVEAELVQALDRPFPGEIAWLRGEDDVEGVLENLGVDKSSAIPIHVLVDPGGMLRCVRVGSVGEEAYGSVKAILAGG